MENWTIEDFLVNRLAVNRTTITAEIEHIRKGSLRAPYILWRPAESNCGHTDFQSVALPTELGRLFIVYQKLTTTNIFTKLTLFNVVPYSCQI